jgi:protein transport protein SEC61 subunit gamma and related proteins
MENQIQKPGLKAKLSSGLSRYGRVWRLLKKPSLEEFKLTSKVSAIGILIIGAIGFVVSVILTLLQ